VAAERLDYPKILEAALRDAVRRVMLEVAEKGLPGGHHFYIAFRTDAPGVSLPRFLQERYPEEMTIVLQHQFWDLAVDDDLFSISLSFDNAPQRLTIPFAALTAFLDPPAEFALRFDGGAPEGEEKEPSLEPIAPELIGEPEPVPSPSFEERVAKAPRSKSERRPGEVVRFDPSRRK
jgi:uncharacterized protein